MLSSKLDDPCVKCVVPVCVRCVMFADTIILVGFVFQVGDRRCGVGVFMVDADHVPLQVILSSQYGALIDLLFSDNVATWVRWYFHAVCVSVHTLMRSNRAGSRRTLAPYFLSTILLFESVL